MKSLNWQISSVSVSYTHLDVYKRQGEELDDASLFILEAAAYTHVIGIRVAEEKYGRCDGKLQEQEGPIIAQKMLSQLSLIHI